MRFTGVGARFCVLVGAVFLTACTHTQDIKADNASFTWTSPQKRILLVAPDISLGEVTTGGMVEPRADWTDAARKSVTGDIASDLSQKGIEVAPLDNLTNPHDIQLAKLHSVVGLEILLHGLGPVKLPTKGSALDWTLGPGAQDMRARYNADYAMFVFVRDSYTSTGRALMMLGAAMFGVGLQGGSQSAFVSLVDLRTGNIVWFNTLFSQSGDLRNDKDANVMVTNLLAGMPL